MRGRGRGAGGGGAGAGSVGFGRKYPIRLVRRAVYVVWIVQSSGYATSINIQNMIAIIAMIACVMNKLLFVLYTHLQMFVFRVKWLWTGK